MKLIIVVLSLMSAPAFAASLTCSDSTGSVTYLPEPLSFQFSGQEKPVEVWGVPEPIPSQDDERSTFKYFLANGESVRITWLTQESEILRNIRARTEKLEIINSRGYTVKAYSNCTWNE
jgi:hypothetical protein